MADFGKCRSYLCPCGIFSIRSLSGDPGECPRCGHDYQKDAYTVEDRDILEERIKQGLIKGTMEDEA